MQQLGKSLWLLLDGGIESTNEAILHEAREMAIRMAESAVVAMKRVTIVEQRADRD